MIVTYRLRHWTIAAALSLVACSPASTIDAGDDAGSAADGGGDVGLDAGSDAGHDAGTDGGHDAGTPSDGGSDAGAPYGTLYECLPIRDLPCCEQFVGDAGVDAGSPPPVCEVGTSYCQAHWWKNDITMSCIASSCTDCNCPGIPTGVNVTCTTDGGVMTVSVEQI